MNLTLDTTIYRQGGMQKKYQEIPFATDKEAENELMNLYPQMKYQQFYGFGGAVTDAAGYVYAQMGKADREKMVNAYFGAEGNGYCCVRIPIDSCDFSVEQFQAVDDPEDTAYQTFSLERWKKYIYPLWQDIRRACSSVEVMVSPWTPPAFMKTNGMRSRGGSLKAECRAAYAEYLCRYVEELKGLGLPVRRMSIQNEPKAVQTWDSCVYSVEEEKIFLRDYLYPAMVRHGLADIGLFIWDHNKERVYERACGIIDETTERIVKGIAFHWYSGDHFEALDMVRQKFPDLELTLSEACIEYSKFDADGELLNVKKYAHEIIGNLNAGMNSFFDWNIVLDENGGPNHVKNFCDAPLLYHISEGSLEERMTFSAIGHFSKYIKPGAVRIACSRYTDELEATAFENPDQSIALILFNRTQKELPVTVRIGEECASFVCEGFSITSGVLKSGQGK